jgi:hypothetical protein
VVSWRLRSLSVREGPPASMSVGSGCGGGTAVVRAAAGQGRASWFSHKEREALLADGHETEGTTASMSVVEVSEVPSMRGWAMGGSGIKGTLHHIGGDEGDAAHAMAGGVSGTHNCIQSGEDLGKVHVGMWKGSWQAMGSLQERHEPPH